MGMVMVKRPGRRRRDGTIHHEQRGAEVWLLIVRRGRSDEGRMIISRGRPGTTEDGDDPGDYKVGRQSISQSDRQTEDTTERERKKKKNKTEKDRKKKEREEAT